MNPDVLTRRTAKPLLFLACLLPAGWLLADVLGWEHASLGANPVEKVQDTLGIWGLRLLLLTLAVPPLREIGRWQRLHRLVYVAAILGGVHFWWQVKADIREPLVYALVAAVLLGWRLQRHLRRRGTVSFSHSEEKGTVPS